MMTYKRKENFEDIDCNTLSAIILIIIKVVTVKMTQTEVEVRNHMVLLIKCIFRNF